MPTLTEREKRTVRLAAVGIAIYLVLFFGWRSWRALEATRADYQNLLADVQKLKRDLRPYENKVLLAEKLKDTLGLDPGKLSRATLVAEASAAIQKAAKTSTVQLGPVRESPARSSAKELVSMQLEGVGTVPAVLTLLRALERTGYPLILDSVQLSPDATKPGKLKLNLTIVILDFEAWKKPEVPRV